MSLKLNELKPKKGTRKKIRRVGRGHASGWGTQAGRGHKGQNSRSGGGLTYTGFEGGQNPLYKRVPKLKGFRSFPKVKFSVINVASFAKLKEDTVVNLENLISAGLIRKGAKYLKVLGNGDLETAWTVQAHKISETAQNKITKAGGKVEVLNVAADKKVVADKKTTAGKKEEK